MKVSIIIPVIRPEKAEKCIYAARINAGIPCNDFEIISLEDNKRIGCPKMVKRLVSMTIGEKICFLGDDSIPQPNFLKYALEDMKNFPDSWGLVAFNDMTGRDLATHWLASRKMLSLLNGEFLHTGYTHCFCDNELQDHCIAAGRFIYSKKAIVLHDHPIINREPLTGDYARVYQYDIFSKDRELFESRRAEYLWN